jgi:hypothetical protein
MGHIFISYSHKDKEYIHRLQEALQNKGFDVWIDDRIDYGTEWPKIIQDYLDSSDAFIVVVSENSYHSEWVQSEVARAKRKKKPFFPLLFQGEPWLSIEARNYVDVTDKSLPNEKFFQDIACVVPRNKAWELVEKERITKENAEREQKARDEQERITIKKTEAGHKIEYGRVARSISHLKVPAFFTAAGMFFAIVSLFILVIYLTRAQAQTTAGQIQTPESYFSNKQFAEYPEGTLSIIDYIDPVNQIERPVTFGETQDNQQYKPVDPAQGARFVAVMINFKCAMAICENPPEADLSLLLADGRPTRAFNYSSRAFFIDEPPTTFDRIANGQSVKIWFVFEVPRITSPKGLIVSAPNMEEPLIVSWPVH